MERMIGGNFCGFKKNFMKRPAVNNFRLLSFIFHTGCFVLLKKPMITNTAFTQESITITS